MNKLNYTKYFFIIIGYLISSNISAQTNRALIVTIANYPKNSGWENIHADNDKVYILEMLSIKKFLPAHIIQLSDTLATKANVIKTLNRLCNEVQSGDVLFLHFSCHGQQMMDDNGDEEDGLDESLVMYDAGYKYIPQQYEGENHLRDDELGIWIHKLRRKAGEKGRITITLDACHSGTANRDETAYMKTYKEYIRGTTAIFAKEGYVPRPGKHQELSLRLKNEKGLATAAVFSACPAEFTNYEYYDRQRSMYVGKLTYSFCRQINKMKDQCTIKTFFSRLMGDMFSLLRDSSVRRFQYPYMECSDETAPFFIGLRK